MEGKKREIIPENESSAAPMKGGSGGGGGGGRGELEPTVCCPLHQLSR